MSQTVPTGPGWWWVEVEGRRRVVEVERMADGGLWFDLADQEYSVPGGGGDDYFEFSGAMSWLAPVATVEEVGQMRRTLRTIAKEFESTGHPLAAIVRSAAGGAQ